VVLLDRRLVTITSLDFPPSPATTTVGLLKALDAEEKRESLPEKPGYYKKGLTSSLHCISYIAFQLQ
jgi:hypothetical protein